MKYKRIKSVKPIKLTTTIIKKQKIKPVILNSHLRKGVGRMELATTIKNKDIYDDDNVILTCMDNIRNSAKKSMGGKRLSIDEVKKILEIVRNEK